MRKNIIKLFSILLVFIAFSCALKANATPPIYVGLTLDYEFLEFDATIDADIIYDNGTFWTGHGVTTIDSSTIVSDAIFAINKTDEQHSYNFTQYNRESGEIELASVGFFLWIETNGLSIGENVTIEDDSYEVMEILDITIPLGTFSVYNLTHNSIDITRHNYYDTSTGFIIKSYNRIDMSTFILTDTSSSSISELPTFLLSLIVIAIPITIKYSKS